MKKKKIYRVPFDKLPDYNREAFTDLLIAGKKNVPFTDEELLINAPFFYSREVDVANALQKRFDLKWRKRKYAAAVQTEERWRKYFLEEEKLDKIPYYFDANSLFKHRFKQEIRYVRIYANMEIARCWVRLLKHCPEYVDRCPWHFFQGDRIWQTLQDEEFLKAIKRTPLQVAQKMNLNAMSFADWDEVLKIVPELASRRPKNYYDCYVE